MTALTLNFDRDLQQVGWMRGKKFMLMTGLMSARVRVEKGWEPVYRVLHSEGSVRSTSSPNERNQPPCPPK